jgi:uncharacterized protein (DUF488 family)
MFYRRKIILALIQLCGGTLEKTRLQKLLFLYSKTKPNPEYEFVPYKFGCYSFSVHADIVTMLKKSYLAESDKGYTKCGSENYLNLITSKDKELLTKTVSKYGKMSNDALIKYTYVGFPYYAINSKIASKILEDDEKLLVQRPKPHVFTDVIFTIGYEGISLENYLNKLLKNNVELLVDVRKNPLSMKFGFSKTLLRKFCENLGIKYVHLPAVGISSDKRQELETQQDYDVLFEDYKATTLKQTKNSQEEILNLLEEHGRIALTCFEANICQCHRLHLAEALKLLNPNLELKHI